MSSERVHLSDFNSVASRVPSLDGAELEHLLDVAEAFLRRYVVMSSAQAVASTLWAAHTHALDAFETTPFLAVTSPEKRCGKSRLLDVLELLVARPWRVITPSEAVLFRKIEKSEPTLMLDETDAIFNAKNGNTEPLRALLNAGNRRGTVVPRCVGPNQTLKDFKIFSARALAGIGRLPDTIIDRSVVIRLQRKRRDETAARFRIREATPAAQAIHDALSEWAKGAIAGLEAARPSVPEALDDRAEEAWEPLLAIAGQAGERWQERARAAALQLSASAQDDEALGVRLLTDIHHVFKQRAEKKITSTALAATLCELEESPWGDLWGKPLDARGLARRLSPFGIRPRSVRFDDGTTPKGYLADQFEDAFARYLADLSATTPQPAPANEKQPKSSATNEGSVADENRRKPAPANGCVVVADKNAGNGGGRVRAGDPGYAMHVDRAFVDGHITDAELVQLIRLDAYLALLQQRTPSLDADDPPAERT